VVVWITLVLALYLSQLFIPSLFRIHQVGLAAYIGSRDDLPPLPRIGSRAERAARNLGESLPLFLTAAVLSVAMGRETDLALLGAQVFLWSRLAYLGLYLTATPWLRSLAWTAGLAGVLMTAWPLFGL
jgi:uncharacterized MAPEG superfamily protein